jgi:hypothetical protein
MATISGTAAGADDLYDILLNFVQLHGWHVMDSETAVLDSQTTVKCVQLRGEDVSGLGNIYVHLIYRAQTLSDIYAFELEGSAGWLPACDVKAFGQNPQNSYRDVGTGSSVTIRVPLHRNPIQYWISCNARRFMGAFRHNDRWGAMYCGFVLPYGMPSQWPYPLWVAGNNITTNDYKTVTNGCPWGASGVLSGMLFMPSGRWIQTPLNGSVSGGRGYGIEMWPYRLSPASNRIQGYKPVVDKNGVEVYSLQNMIFYGPNSSEYGTFGEPDGLYHVTSWGAAGGDILKIASQDFLLVQREMSTANNTSAAMLLE